ncbi:LacI family DNA-binding transcriptional regulator [Flavitalea sp. BT771]|uniref:LacI family DNA-binding transcriptional regulator n=1 Tax=Flavitalea sp. BT771 TaxID=3063329 RepID=UPI0026E2876B|nr:LacI family DNA-binding transcriptional regulator [Flavitalea sp. BT771]MDO6432490.1 LacI family DNA-binding transcriptional regulator [Flavitalea sp. BT771]MDV6221399.1 LacI family DNA-binding transcriptional regulator [Flavitalea sp. BT771]
MSTPKEITIYDLARKLNISIATVSRALKDDPVVSKKTRKKIADLAEKMGYRSNNFARNLRTQRTNTIGVIVPRLNSYFMAAVIAGIESVANSDGYNLIISQSSESARKEMASAKTMFNSRVDGLLVSLAYDTDSINHFDAFIKKNIPLVFFDRVEEHENCLSILINNKRAAYEATTHLISQGRRRIVYITATPKRNVYIHRLEGYKEALKDQKIRFREDYVLLSNLSQEAGVEAAAVIRQMDPLPDAVFVANDNCAVGCMVALKQGGIRIPEDIAFVGFNNDPVSTVVEPNLTTINYPGYEMGQVAARNLINHLNGASSINVTNTIILRSELIVRESSGRNR